MLWEINGILEYMCVIIVSFLSLFVYLVQRCGHFLGLWWSLHTYLYFNSSIRFRLLHDLNTLIDCFMEKWWFHKKKGMKHALPWHLFTSRATYRSWVPRGPASTTEPATTLAVMWWTWSTPLVGIGLTKLLNSGVAKAPPLTTALHKGTEEILSEFTLLLQRVAWLSGITWIAIVRAGLSPLEVPGVPWLPQFLAYQ